MKFSYKALIAGALMSVSAVAMALPVTGGVSFVSNAPDPSFDATSVSFGTNPNPGEGNGRVTSASGDYANYFAFGDDVDFTDFQYNPFISSPQLVWNGTGSLNPTNMSFYLESIGSSNYSTSQLTMTGKGYLTDGVIQEGVNWNFTANNAGNTFSWSASTAVPEPGTLALLGLGVAGLAAARRRQKAA